MGRILIDLSRSQSQRDARPANPGTAFALLWVSYWKLPQAQATTTGHEKWVSCPSRHLQESEKVSLGTILAACGMEMGSAGVAVWLMRWRNGKTQRCQIWRSPAVMEALVAHKVSGPLEAEKSQDPVE